MVTLALVVGCGFEPDHTGAERSSVPAADSVTQLVGVRARLGTGAAAPSLWLASARMSPDGSGSGAVAETRIDGPTPLVVTGDRSAWSLAEKRVVFEGHVRATRGEVVLTADRMELAWVGDKVDRVVALGSVELRRGARLATAGRAELTVSTGRIDLRESPVLREGPNRLVGDEMALYLDEDRLDCDRCRLEIAGEALVP